MKLIKRDGYIDRLMALRGTPDIKVITGVRRAGKSKLLEDLKDWIVAEGRENVIFIDLSDLRRLSALSRPTPAPRRRFVTSRPSPKR